ncbi:glutaredoxin family protein [Bacillus massilinigeriensis]|uniref:glutaredoxin family protein n=1 Tax=Bacillus mediterraneensis TaxID=1805474 RepID=UPI0008F925B4|nr:glutaredoxin family protein [Bacillus mediterraneensis]
MKPFIVYTQDECPPCTIVKLFLNDQGVKYVEKNISSNHAFKDELTEKYGIMSTPTIIAGKERIVGFNLARLKEVIDSHE